VINFTYKYDIGLNTGVVITFLPVSAPDKLEDAGLMNRVAVGDRGYLWLSLYDQYAVKVHGLALRVLGDPLNAEEVTQDAFVRLCVRADTPISRPLQLVHLAAHHHVPVAKVLIRTIESSFAMKSAASSTPDSPTLDENRVSSAFSPLTGDPTALHSA